MASMLDTDRLQDVVRRGGGGARRRFRRAELAVHRRMTVGDRVTCPCCGWSGPAFAASDRFTTERYRQLALDGDDDRFWLCRRPD